VSGSPQTVVEALSLAARHELWRRGQLCFKFEKDKTQQELYRLIFASPRRQFMLECARKLGKSYLLGVIALEACIKHPGKRVNWCLPTGKQAIETAVPILTEISEDAPPECRGSYNSQSGHWTLPNGAYIVLFGAKDKADADRGRGPSAIVSLVDEGAFFPSEMLPYALRSVIAPQHMRTKGKIILASTPPVGMGHSWNQIAAAAETNGAYAHRTIWQNGMLSREEILETLNEAATSAGLTLDQYMTTAEYRREYMAERVIDPTRSVIPEFAPNESQIVQEFDLPEHFDAFAGIDLGYSVHASAVVHGVADFNNQRLLIVDETWLVRANTREIAEATKRTEAKHWTRPEARYLTTVQEDGTKRDELAAHLTEPGAVFRVIDNAGGGSRVIADFWDQFRLRASEAVKKDRDQAISLVRNLCLGGRLIINPRCERLIRQLRTATWNSAGSEIEESAEEMHYDLVPALYMMVRCWWHLKTRNPYPPKVAGYGQYIHKPAQQVNALARGLLGGTAAGRRIIGGLTR
jgi:hypothetical protein